MQPAPATPDDPAPGDSSAETLEAPPESPAAVVSHPHQIGPYRILECIGEGGMGVVYKAEQRQPVRRLVALKVIKLGMDTREVVARFEAERQALAMLSHPNVAKVFEAGTTEQGRPYFAMEYVPGVPLTQYCDENKLSTQQRLELFIPVCHAIQHAHHKGIIHRDLKPTNILVTLFDGQPVPKVIDFGIAKATNSALTQQTLFTQTGAMVGTPEYMSPEQAMTSGLDVDTRTDVYSLGVILYELLTGTLPFDPNTLRKAGLEQMARLIKDAEPDRPSLRMTELGRTPRLDSDPKQIARLHDTDLRTLQRELKGDLDWIVLKAMEKDRTRRYETANALAMDIRRHLDNEPVLARPPSTSYRLAKFVRKHRVMVLAAGAVAAALVIGLLATTLALVQAHRDRDRARLAQLAESRQREAAERAKDEASAANRFMRDLFTSFGLPQQEARRRLAAAVKRLDDGWLKDQHETRAASRMMIAYAYLQQRAIPESEAQFNATLDEVRLPDGGYPPETAGAVFEGLGIINLIKPDRAAAEKHFERAAAEYRNLPGAAGQLVFVLNYLIQLRTGHGDLAGARKTRVQLIDALTAEKSAQVTSSPTDAKLLHERAIYRIRAGRLREAGDDLTRSSALDPSDPWTWYMLACLRLYLGDDAGYREACGQMLQRFADSDQREVVDRTAKSCLLSSRPAADVDRLMKLANRAAAPGAPAETLPWFILCKGFAEYRAGHYAEARHVLSTARPLNGAGGMTRDLLIAMSDHRLSEANAARMLLQLTERQIASQLPSPGEDDLGASPENYLICQILRREAKTLITPNADQTPRQ